MRCPAHALQELCDYDIMINCIYLRGPTPPFITFETIDEAGKDRKLSIVVDVSCDPNSAHNPVPLYKA
jgi:saccharopine dehydrogenase (NAD+, L-lysine-forming)